MSDPPDPFAPPELRFTVAEDDGIDVVLQRTLALRRRAFHSVADSWRSDRSSLPVEGQALASGRTPERQRPPRQPAAVGFA